MAIYGAGAAGINLLASLENSAEYMPMMLIDDNKKIQGMTYAGIKVHSFEKAINRLEKLKVKTVLLAMPSASPDAKKTIIEKLTKHSLTIKTVPKHSDLIEGKSLLNHFNQVSVDELLGRNAVAPVRSLLAKDIAGKTILVTGAGGSIGTELCLQTISENPKTLILYDSSEYNLFQLQLKVEDACKKNNIQTKIVPVLGQIQNERKVDKMLTLYDVDTIYHTAAYKHVPIVEMNINEAFDNNVRATHVLARLASKHEVKKFVLISSDKAVRPTNYMGASKRISELICQAFCSPKTKTIFSIVRFGNVLGSSGSVMSRFQEQILKGGPLTVTHAEITRFFMTKTEAAQLVIQAGALAKGGEVFILDMGEPVKIIELAEKMVKLYGMRPFHSNNSEEGDIEIKISGLRPGEKLYEELLLQENANTTIHERIMVAQEERLSLDTLETLLNDIYMAIEEFDADKLEGAIQKMPIYLNGNSLENDVLLSFPNSATHF